MKRRDVSCIVRKEGSGARYAEEQTARLDAWPVANVFAIQARSKDRETANKGRAIE